MGVTIAVNSVARAKLLSVAGVFLLSVGAGFWLHRHVWILSAVTGMLLVLGVVWPVLTVWAVRVEVGCKVGRAREGAGVEVRVGVRNRWPVPWFDVQLVGLAGGEVVVGTIWPWGKMEMSVEGVVERRGWYPPAVGVVCSFPLNLVEARGGVGGEGRCLVWPAARWQKEVSLANMPGSEAQLSARVPARAGTSGDLMGVRPYRRGDSPRQIHWMQTARYDRLIVRELQAQPRMRCCVVVDADLGAYESAGHLDEAMRVAAGVIERLHGDGVEVMLMVGRQRVGRQQVGEGAVSLAAALDALAVAGEREQPVLVELLAVMPVDRPWVVIASSGRRGEVAGLGRGSGVGAPSMQVIFVEPPEAV
jgi:uncharacterized protein (DUF58 family)